MAAIDDDNMESMVQGMMIVVGKLQCLIIVSQLQMMIICDLRLGYDDSSREAIMFDNSMAAIDDVIWDLRYRE